MLVDAFTISAAVVAIVMIGTIVTLLRLTNDDKDQGDS